MTTHDEYDQRVEEATRRRLARLASVPVDTSRLERRLDATLAQVARKQRPRIPRRTTQWRTITAIAAMVALAVMISLVIVRTTSPRVASASELVQLHEAYLEGAMSVTNVASIQQANREMAAQWGDAPICPGTGTADCQVMSYCVEQLQGCSVGCVHVVYKNTPVTIVVAHDEDLRLPENPEPGQTGRRTLIQEVGQYQVVTIMDADRYVSLIGKLPADDLVNLALDLEF